MSTTTTTTTTTPTTARQRLTNFSRRFSRQSKQGSSYFPPTSTTTTTATTTDNVTDAPNHSHANSWEGGHHPAGTGTTNGRLHPGDATTTTDPVADSTAAADATTPSSSNITPLSPQYHLRPPLTHRHSPFHNPSSFRLPDLPWLCGTWHITHSTLPMWRTKRNVRITYTRLPGNRLDDCVTYQNLGSDEVKTVAGVDSPKRDGSWVWRGKGWLRVASSRWEVLGWGGGGGRHVRGEGDGERKAGEGIVEMEAPVGATGDEEVEEQWVVTYFAKTPFTPAGIDIYSRRSAGLSEATMEKLRLALVRLDGRKRRGVEPKNELGRLVDGLFEVTKDGARADLVE